MPITWTKSLKDFIRQNCHILKDEEIAAQLSRLTGRFFSTGSICQQRESLGIQKSPGAGVCRVVREKEKLGANKLDIEGEAIYPAIHRASEPAGLQGSEPTGSPDGLGSNEGAVGLETSEQEAEDD